MTPKSYNKVMASFQFKKWYAAYKSEYDSQVAQNMFTITILLYDHKTIKRKWVFKLKKNPNGSIKKCKAR